MKHPENGNQERELHQVDLEGDSLERSNPPSNVQGSVRAEDDDLGAGRAAYGDDLETLDRRRTEELKLIGRYDS